MWKTVTEILGPDAFACSLVGPVHFKSDFHQQPGQPDEISLHEMDLGLLPFTAISQ